MKTTTLIATIVLLMPISMRAQVTVVPSGNVGIGTNSPAHKLDVNGDVLVEARNRVYFENRTPTQYKYIGSSYNFDLGLVSNKGTWLRIGSDNGIGFWGQAGAETSTVPTNMFVSQYGVGIGASAQAWNGITFYVDGNAWINGSYFWVSDERLKQQVRPIEKALDKIAKLKGVSYDPKRDGTRDANLGGKRNLGLIAQEVSEVLPEAVTKDNKGFYGINYVAIIPVLVEAIKEQNKAIEGQRHEIESLRNKVTELTKPSPVKTKSETKPE